MQISGRGISLELPRGWEGLIVGGGHDIPPGAMSTTVVHAANFALPPPDSITVYGTNSVRRMAPGAAFLALVEMNPKWAGVGLYATAGLPRLTPSDFSGATLEVGMPGRVGVQRFVHVGGRTFIVYAVVAANKIPHESEVAGLNSVLKSVSVGPPRKAYYYHAPNVT